MNIGNKLGEYFALDEGWVNLSICIPGTRVRVYHDWGHPDWGHPD